MHEKPTQVAFVMYAKVVLRLHFRTKVRYCLFLPGSESYLYIDGHRKPVYSDVLLPRGLIGRLGVVLGCRALL
jgi:hypothetical protein